MSVQDWYHHARQGSLSEISSGSQSGPAALISILECGSYRFSNKFTPNLGKSVSHPNSGFFVNPLTYQDQHLEQIGTILLSLPLGRLLREWASESDNEHSIHNCSWVKHTGVQYNALQARTTTSISQCFPADTAALLDMDCKCTTIFLYIERSVYPNVMICHL